MMLLLCVTDILRKAGIEQGFIKYQQQLHGLPHVEHCFHTGWMARHSMNVYIISISFRNQINVSPTLSKCVNRNKKYNRNFNQRQFNLIPYFQNHKLRLHLIYTISKF